MGSATGEQALAMLKAKEDERMASKTLVAASKDQAKYKRAKDITALVITGRLRDLEDTRAARPFRAALPND